jgi:hypothetical protein
MAGTTRPNRTTSRRLTDRRPKATNPIARRADQLASERQTTAVPLHKADTVKPHLCDLPSAELLTVFEEVIAISSSIRDKYEVAQPADWADVLRRTIDISFSTFSTLSAAGARVASPVDERGRLHSYFWDTARHVLVGPYPAATLQKALERAIH